LLVSFPLFDGGARAAASAAARAGYDEAVALYRAQARRAVREVEASLVALQASAEREADAVLAAQDYTASLRATQARQNGGLASLFDLEAARRNAVAAQSALIDLQRERALAWISLYRALGGGWSEAELSAAALPAGTE
jgi:outer membrane protein TolC